MSEDSPWISPSATPLPIISRSVVISVDPENRREKILEIYEEKYKTFAVLSIKKNTIFKYIYYTLLLELNVDIDQLFENDFHSFNMVVAAFFGRKYALDVPKEEDSNVREFKEVDFLPDCNLPLHTVIVMCYASHYMRNLFIKEGSGLELEQAKYDILKNHFQDIACRIINHLYYLPRKGPERARAALQADYNPKKTPKEKQEIRSQSDNLNSEPLKTDGNLEETSEEKTQKISTHRHYLNRKFNQNKEIMAIAYKAEAMKFLSQKPCLYLMKIRYKCKDRKQRPCQGAYGVRKIHQCIDWRPSMRFKLWFHAIFRIIYIFMFAYMLCRVPVYDDHRSVNQRDWDEEISVHYVSAVLFAQLGMTLIKIVNYLKYSPRSSGGRFTLLIRYYKSNQLAICRVILISFIFGLEATRISIGAFGPKSKDGTIYHSGLVFIPLILELAYCLLFIISAMATLRFFYSIKSLGFFTHLIKKMLRTVRMFVFIFCAFWFVLAVTHVSISRTFTSVNSTTNNTFIHTIASQGKFEIFGEVQDEDRTGDLTGCEDYNRTIHDLFSMSYKEASCLFRSSVLPFLVFFYIFMAGVLLVNLLTAQLTKEYEKEAENSRYYNGYLQYEQLCKIESKIYLPPPLSIIYILLIILLTPFCCCDPCFRFLWENTIKLIDGDPYQAVKRYTDKFGAEAEVKEFLNRKQDILGRMKDLIANYEEDESNIENLMTVQMQLNKLFKLEKNKEKIRENIRSRGAYSQMEDIDEDDPAEEMILAKFSLFL